MRTTIGLAVAGLLGLLLVTTFLVTASEAERAGPATRPIGAPQATVAPDVAREMNGKQSRVEMAEDVAMHPPTALHRRGQAKGQGNGCHRGYGEPGQCLPLHPAGSRGKPHAWTCAEVRELFPTGLVVTRDRLRLDSDGDGRACGRGDA